MEVFFTNLQTQTKIIKTAVQKLFLSFLSAKTDIPYANKIIAIIKHVLHPYT